jgi:HEAT repeat protein
MLWLTCPLRRILTAGITLTLAAAGCSASATRQQFASPYPLDRARAAVQAAEHGDGDAIHKLVDLLDDDDRAVRMYAILALERLTGDTFGYVYYADEASRAAAVERWRSALRDGRVTLRTAPRSTIEAAPGEPPLAARDASAEAGRP